MNKPKRLFGIIIITALGIASTALAQKGDNRIQTHTIFIKDFAFVPDHLTVSAGDTVIWKNEDVTPHTATDEGVFDSKEIDTTKSWTYKATRKGKFPYTCTYHPNMHGQLTVQ